MIHLAATSTETRAAPAARNARTGHAGLGLAITKGIVTAHDGQIWLGDGPGGEVYVTLPKSVTSIAQPQAVQQTQTAERVKELS